MEKSDIKSRVEDKAAEIEDMEQKMAYQSFINVLSAILVKYASEIEN